MTEPARKRPPGGARRTRTSLGVVGSALVIAVAAAYSYAVPRGWTMEGPAMQPALADGDRFFTLALPPRLGDVVVLESPAGGATVVKRVVGLPGDTIELREGRLVRNGSVVTGPARVAVRADREGVVCAREHLGRHVYDVVRDPAFPDSHSAVRVPPHDVFVLGDQRDRSNDSRYFGSVPIRSVLGRLFRVTSRVAPSIRCPR